ncbi:putative acetyl-CoA acyltransferase [bacterium HR10]|nr:putative acetyl-CoA acyltransferase [bacterium HR10]
MARAIYLAGAVRTPIGKFGGALREWTAADLAVPVVREAVRRAGLTAEAVDEVIIGCARQAGVGPNVARQIAYRAGLGERVPAYTVNRACGSGLQAILDAACQILAGRARVLVAGGTEAMSRVPYLLDAVRWGHRAGHAPLVDAMYRDGFLCPLSQMVMGETAEKLADLYGISRQEQDQYALRSHVRAARAQAEGAFDAEILPLELSPSGAAPRRFDRDEHVRPETTLERLAELPPVFRPGGTVTAGNSSGITDGAAAVCVLSEDVVRESGVRPQARLLDWAVAGVDPSIMGIAPVPAVRELLARHKLTLSDIDLIELNEAFAAQVLACDRELHLDHDRLNVHGGAIALGHPIGCTGARIVVTLLHALERYNGRLGLATLCISGGQGIALLVERT